MLKRKLCVAVSERAKIGGCLCQRDDDDVTKVTCNGVGEKPIKFFSQKLTACRVD
jgi:hypothetical protein